MLPRLRTPFPTSPRAGGGDCSVRRPSRRRRGVRAGPAPTPSPRPAWRRPQQGGGPGPSSPSGAGPARRGRAYPGAAGAVCSSHERHRDTETQRHKGTETRVPRPAQSTPRRPLCPRLRSRPPRTGAQLARASAARCDTPNNLYIYIYIYIYIYMRQLPNVMYDGLRVPPAPCGGSWAEPRRTGHMYT
jgi:hypothetical protein